MNGYKGWRNFRELRQCEVRQAFIFHAQAWPSMWGEMLKRRTVDADGRAREAASTAFKVTTTRL
jgi:hypothetical protein